jgi:hypothetical protein
MGLDNMEPDHNWTHYTIIWPIKDSTGQWEWLKYLLLMELYCIPNLEVTPIQQILSKNRTLFKDLHNETSSDEEM